MNERAILYRKMESIPDEWGTAVNVQAMVFGNMGETSATGFVSAAMPVRVNLFNGEYLINAQVKTLCRYPYSATDYKGWFATLGRTCRC